VYQHNQALDSPESLAGTKDCNMKAYHQQHTGTHSDTSISDKSHENAETVVGLTHAQALLKSNPADYLADEIK